MEQIDMSDNHPEPTFWGKVIRILIPLLLIAAGAAAFAYFKATAPVMQKAKPERKVAVVDVQTARLADTRAVVSAMGTVVAAREVTLKAQVSGTVLSVAAAYVPGGSIAKGAELLSLDPVDYEVAVQKAQSALATAKAALAIEQGSQNIAREELALMSALSSEGVSETDLALRKPQLAQAQADVTSAEADLRQAMLDLNRTVVRAPFNAMVVERNVNVGTYAGAQDSLATLVGTDEFWIEAVVSLDQLALIDLHYPGGCPVTIKSQVGTGTWTGYVVQVAGKLSESSRMATVIVSVKNPLGAIEKPSPIHLMIDDYVNVEITGRELANVIELPRAVMQDGKRVWVYDNGALDIRKVTLAWKSTAAVYLDSGVKAGEKVVTSALATPVQGMALKVADAQPAAATDAEGR